MESTDCNGDTCSFDESDLNNPPSRTWPIAFVYLSYILFAVLWVLLYGYLATLNNIYGLALIVFTVGIYAIRRFSRSRKLKIAGGLDAQIGNGKIVVVEIFSDACMPCIAMKPLVRQLRKAGSAYGIEVITLSIFSKSGIAAARTYGVVATPTFIAFDKQGNEIYRDIKPPSVTSLQMHDKTNLEPTHKNKP